MISDPELPFDRVPTGVGAGAEVSPADSVGAPAERSAEVFPGAAPARSTPGLREQAASDETTASAIRLWLRRLGVLLFVFLCATVGVMLVILPWRPEWAENSLVLRYPVLHQLVSAGFTRGVVTGLGILNVWVGFSEAVQYRED